MSDVIDTRTNPSPDYPQLLGHPRPLWMLFMTEFWERFAFYSVSWALALYVVAHFFNGNASGQAWAATVFSSYTALIYASSIFGGYVADRIIGYQRSILLGALVMALGLFVVMLPSRDMFLIGLAMVIVGNGLFKPNISTMVGQLYGRDDPRRDRQEGRLRLARRGPGGDDEVALPVEYLVDGLDLDCPQLCPLHPVQRLLDGRMKP